jgi:hypothetical protein
LVWFGEIERKLAKLSTTTFIYRSSSLLFYGCNTLQRHNTENSKQMFPGKELRGLSPNSYIHVSVSDLYITTIGLPILLQEKMWTDRENI